MNAAAWIHNNRTQEPELQAWVFDPDSDDWDWADPDRAWFKSENTGAGKISPTFTGPDAVQQAEQWGRENPVQVTR